MKIQSTIYYLREYFFPTGCGGCGKALGHADARYGLCEKCRSAFGIALLSGRRCRYCGKPLITERELCLPCRETLAGGKEAAEIACGDGSYSKHIKRLRVLFPYAGKFKTVLGSYKFEKATALGIFFARCLSLSLEAFGLKTFEPQAIEKAAWVPVPPRPGKLKAHGWDQVEFMAKQLDKTGGFAQLPVTRCLARLPSKSQKLLGREQRLANLKGRIRCVKKPPETAILFDDVITTGATIDACAAALLEAGAKRVYAVCLFYR
jgi:ComF family protein